MKSNKLFLWITVTILLLVLGIASYNVLFADKKIEKKNVSVILNDSMNEKWVVVKQGMDQAALDYNLELNIVATKRIEYPEDEASLIMREVDNGAEGIIIEPVSGDGYSDYLSAVSGAVGITLINSDINPENHFDCVMPDQKEIGRALANALLNDYKSKTPVIGILTSNTEQLGKIQRTEGLNEVLDSNVRIAWTFDIDSTEEENIKKRIEGGEVDAIVALGNYETDWILDYLISKTGKQKIKVYAADYSAKSIYNLDRGIIEELVITDEYCLGYSAVESLAGRLSPSVKGTKTGLKIYSIDMEGMYDEELQKILFPLVQ